MRPPKRMWLPPRPRAFSRSIWTRVTRVFAALPLPAAKIGKASPGSSRNGNRRWNTIWLAPLRARPPSPPRPKPEWEPSPEYDRAGGLARVAAVAAPAKPAPEIAKPSPEIIASINRLIPDVSVVSVEQAGQIFHAEFVKQCGAVGAELETQVNAAQQQVVQAQNGGSGSDLQAARQHLQQVQLAQGEKLKKLDRKSVV